MITRDMKIEEIVIKYPTTLKVFQKYGLECLYCSAVSYENIEEGARIHGIDIVTLLEELERCCKENKANSANNG